MTENLKLSSIWILFYKRRGRFLEDIIRGWTNSPYAHSEFMRTDGLMHSNDRFSFVSRLSPLDINYQDWDSVEILLPDEIIARIQKRQLKKVGTKYDWTGIVFSQIASFGIHDKSKWFCSKSNADDLLYAYKLMNRVSKYKPFSKTLCAILEFTPQEYSPAKLYNATIKIMHTQKQL